MCTKKKRNAFPPRRWDGDTDENNEKPIKKKKMKQKALLKNKHVRRSGSASCLHARAGVSLPKWPSFEKHRKDRRTGVLRATSVGKLPKLPDTHPMIRYPKITGVSVLPSRFQTETRAGPIERRARA